MRIAVLIKVFDSITNMLLKQAQLLVKGDESGSSVLLVALEEFPLERDWG